MATSEELRGRARATWAAGDWDRFARVVAPVGELVLEPQGRWDEFIAAFADLVRRFNAAEDGGAQIESEYFLITAEP